MNVLIIVDRTFARQEPDMLSRLEVGLADEGVRVVHALPFTGLAPVTTETLGLFTTMVVYQDRGLPFSTGQRARQLLESVADQAESLERIDAVHVFGHGAWDFSMEVGRQAGAPVLLEVWRADLIASAVKTVRAWRASGFSSTPPLVLTPDAGLRSELAKQAPTMKVLTAPWGVHAPPAPRSSSLGETIAAAMLIEDGTGNGAAVPASLEGVAEVVKTHANLMLFVGGEAADQERMLWKHARRLGLLERLSMVPEMEGRRLPVLEMDLLLMPRAGGWHHTLALDAMASGMSVVALADPLADYLIEGRTARLVHRSSAQAWAEALGRMIDDEAERQHVRDTAWDYVRTDRSASAHVRAVLKAYDAAVEAAPVGPPKT